MIHSRHHFMNIHSTTGERGKNIIQKTAMGLLVISLTFSPIGQIFAQETDIDTLNASVAEDDGDSSSDVQTTLDPAISDSATLTDTLLEPTSGEVLGNSILDPETQDAPPQGLDPPAGEEETVSDNAPAGPTSEAEAISEPEAEPAEVMEEQKVPHEKTKFKKDNARSKELQLSAVRAHLEANEAPQNIIDRLDAYEKRQQEQSQGEGFFKKIVDFVTGNTDVQKEQRKIEALSKKESFKVVGFEGEVRKVNNDAFDQLFPNQKEQSVGLLQKIKNFIKNGSFENKNFDGTEDEAPLSWILGQKANAQASSDPNDYLAAGGEIIFSQAVQDQAGALSNDPLSMLNFVRNKIGRAHV